MPDWPAVRTGKDADMVRRDRYGEQIEDLDDLMLHSWDGNVRHALRTARETLPPREPDVRDATRREGLKTRLRGSRRR